MKRAIGGLFVLLTLVAAACASDDPDVDRRGGPAPQPMEDPPLPIAGAGGGGSEIRFCEALEVIRAKCQRCHTDPPQNGAPVPFLTYEDIRAPYFESTTRIWADAMLNAVTKGFMPFVRLNDPPTSLMPPVEPLTEEEKLTLMTWLEQGALPIGPTQCP